MKGHPYSIDINKDMWYYSDDIHCIGCFCYFTNNTTHYIYTGDRVAHTYDVTHDYSNIFTQVIQTSADGLVDDDNDCCSGGKQSVRSIVFKILCSLSSFLSVCLPVLQ